MSSINDKMDGSLSKLFDSFGNERETPWDFYWRLDDEFHFTLDPCASHRNPFMWTYALIFSVYYAKGER